MARRREGGGQGGGAEGGRAEGQGGEWRGGTHGGGVLHEVLDVLQAGGGRAADLQRGVHVLGAPARLTMNSRWRLSRRACGWARDKATNHGQARPLLARSRILQDCVIAERHTCTILEAPNFDSEFSSATDSAWT